jgi:RHS repeat-associated protein
MDFAYDLNYDSSVWYPVASGSTTQWQPATSSWGWQGSFSKGEPYISYTMVYSPGQCYTGNSWNYYYMWGYSNFIYYDQFGASHVFGVGGAYFQNTGTCGPANGPNPSTVPWTAVAPDGSGYTIKITPNAGYVNANLLTTDGTILNPLLSANPPSQQTPYSSADRNGNEINADLSGHFYDTLSSTTPALTVTGTGTPTSPVTFTYTAPVGSASYKVVYSTYKLQTHFGCSNVTEYGGSNGFSAYLVSEVDLPDGSKYSFGYESTLGGASGAVTGRLASVTFPSGGTISYTYLGGDSSHNGITCADGSAAGLKRYTPDTGSSAYWNYARTPGTGKAYTTTITDPTSSANQTVIHFQGIYETQRQVYQGSTSGTLLTTTNTCYNGAASPCTSTAISLPITQRNVTSQIGISGSQSLQILKYNVYGLLTEEDDYDYASGTPTTVLKRTYIAYATLSNGIVDKPGTITICTGTGTDSSCNGVGTRVAQTTYTYDQGSVSTSGAPQLGTVSGSRGNATTIASLVSGGTTLSKSFTYYDTGMVKTATDVNSGVTTFSYSGTSCGYAFPTGVTEAISSLTRSYAWNCSGAVQTSVTDENGKTTTIVYSDTQFWRPYSVTDASGAVTTYSYALSSPYNWTEASMPIVSGTSVSDVRTTVDGLGRPILQQTKQGPSASNYDTVETDYDSLGRVSKVTLPFNAAAGTANSSAPGTSTQYDALGRVSSVSDSGGGTTSYTYNNNDDLVVTTGQPSGENPKRRQFEYNGLGRLTSVCEVTAGTSSFPGGACGQNNPLTGYLTQYAYDTIGDLTSVTQNAQTGGTPQSRSYTYDALGRITSETNPEIGPSTGATAINYTYDSASGCTGPFSGDLVKKVDPQGDTVCFAYDALHRKTSITYSGGYASVTPNKYFVYDSATVNSVAMANAKSRMAEAYTATSQNGTKITDEGFGYSSRGETVDVYELTPHSSPSYYHVSQTYWPHGAQNQLSSNISGLPTVTYGGTIGSTVGLDGEGRITQVTAGSGQNPVTGVTYNPYGTPPTQTVTFGSGDSDVFTYDANTNRMTKYQFNVGTGGQSDSGTLTWNANSTLGQLVIADAFNSGDNQTCIYGYDDMVRVNSANCGSVEAQTFTYDPFGNITKAGNPGQSFQPNYSMTRNRISSVGSSNAQYDNNGNALTDTVHNYTWDADGNAITVDTVGAAFNALGRMVEQNRSNVYTEIVYSPAGDKLALMSGQTLQSAFIPLPGGAKAVYTSAGLNRYRHSDWLGSNRLTSSPTRTVLSTAAYAPFGDTYAQSGIVDPSFTGQNSDTVSGDYDFLAREYNTQGRWPSPDPAGLDAASPVNPQSWNRYAYVLNNPLGMVDPTGLCGETEEGGSWLGGCMDQSWGADYGGPPPTGQSQITTASSGGETLLYGCSGPTGAKNQASNCGYQFGDDQKKLPSWYPPEVNQVLCAGATQSGNTKLVDCTNLPSALQDKAYIGLVKELGQITNAYGSWSRFYNAMGITDFNSLPSFPQPITPPASAAICAAAAKALSNYEKAHNGGTPPQALVQALNQCSLGN